MSNNSYDSFDFVSLISNLMIKSLEQDLDYFWKNNIGEYPSRLNEIKSCGYIVYRNSLGQHKVLSHEYIVAHSH